MSNVQILETNGRPAFAVLPYDDYLELLRRAGNEERTDAADIAAAQAAKEEAGDASLWAGKIPCVSFGTSAA